MANTVLLLGAFDTKGQEYAFVRDRIVELGCDVYSVDTGVMDDPVAMPVDVSADEVARAGGSTLQALRARNDRGEAMKVMSDGAAVVARQLLDAGRIDAIFGMGGTGGSSVVTAAMRSLPVGVPKVCVSTAASGDTSAYVGTKDVVLIPSIVDVAGINRVSRIIFTRAAGAIAGMVQAAPEPVGADKPVIVASMFGNTTQCVDACREALSAKGYEILVFHATGAGGRTMESLIDEGLVNACLDITTTEWADQVCGGVFDAGPDRLRAAGRAGIPHLIVPGCVDMANFGGPESVPHRYKDVGRKFYEWNPSVTLMRTNTDENRRMGEAFAAAANEAKGPVAVLIPLNGVSILDGDGEMFCDRDADQAMFDAVKENLRDDIPVVEVEMNINDTAFSDKAVAMMLEMIRS